MKRILYIENFTPISQDKIAMLLIDKARATSDIRSGHLDEAFKKLRQRWSSLPGGRYAHHTLAQFKERFRVFLLEESK